MDEVPVRFGPWFLLPLVLSVLRCCRCDFCCIGFFLLYLSRSICSVSLSITLSLSSALPSSNARGEDLRRRGTRYSLDSRREIEEKKKLPISHLKGQHDEIEAKFFEGRAS
ncbi:hypothetical protein RIF29_03523 [Crotalaria pallida]|uniref:Uncharacterized protein n=1 Tax=Crotalaria pallida TaxID=3830 RepID=A0AAN9P8T5_CROPI